MLRFNGVWFGLAVLCALSLAAGSQADTISIPVPNGDFSSPATSSYVEGVPTSWTDTQPIGTGVAVGGMNGSSDQFLFQGIGANESRWLHQVDLGASFVVGDAYTLDFYYANGQTNPYELTANIVCNGGAAIVSQAYSVAASQGWTHGSISGTATSTTAGVVGVVFMFTTPNVGGNWQPWLDHVTLAQTTVPEPSAVMLLATALFGLLAYAWRRR